MAESNFEAYRFSKLRRFLGLVRFGMEDTLRFLVEGSIAKFVTFMQVGVWVQVAETMPHCVWLHGMAAAVAADRLCMFKTSEALGSLMGYRLYLCAASTLHACDSLLVAPIR